MPCAVDLEAIQGWLNLREGRVHLLGVAGSGMSGLARLLLERGVRVSGSDLKETAAVKELRDLGMAFHQGHAGGQVKGASLVAYSSAITPTNPERSEARTLGVPEVRRADLLAALCLDKKCLVVAGTHGKTTTTSMLTQVLREAGKDPAFYIGAEVPELGRSAAWTASEFMVIEADESDGSMTSFRPASCVILNIEEEHLDHYGSIDAIKEAFSVLFEQTRERVVYCVDDAEACGLLHRNPRGVGYGFGANARYQITNLELDATGSKFTVLRDGEELGRLQLMVPGRHNASNATAVCAMASELGIPFASIQAALARFGGAARRFEVKFSDADWMVVDDYAHHPSEIRATLAAAKSRGYKRILAVFQPHRYSRTLSLKESFAHAFDDADLVFFADIYASSELPIPGVDGQTLPEVVRTVGHRGVVYSGSLANAKTDASLQLRQGDLVLVMGAGDVHLVAEQLATDLGFFRKIESLVEGRGVLKAYEPMRKHTTLRVGGPAQVWFEPEDEEVLGKLVEFCTRAGVAVTLIGRGSNLLVKDHGIRGVCIHLGRKHFQRVEVREKFIEAGAGARLKEIVFAAKKAGVGGLEFMEGIPGNLGGALRMNAGAMQSWTFEVVESVRVMDRQGKVREIPRDKIDVAYRSVPLFRDHIALSARLSGKPAEPEQIQETLARFSRKRWSSQPAAPSAGCTFKNDEKIPAGKLIDELGLKNSAVGAARISLEHGNFIVNDGEARAADVLALMEKVKETAERERGIRLEAEVIILGE